MWWTSAGERVLSGTEWELFRAGLSCLWDDVEASEEEDGPGTTGIAVFDEIPKAERLALLASVAKGLTDEDEPCQDLTAFAEGTVRRDLRPYPLPDRGGNRTPGRGHDLRGLPEG